MLSLTPLSPFPLTLLPRSCANATSDSLFQQWLGVPHCPLFPAKGYSTTEQLCWVRVHRRWGCPGRVHATDEAVKMKKVLWYRTRITCVEEQMVKRRKNKKKVHFFFPRNVMFPPLFSPMHATLSLFLLHLLISLLPNLLLPSAFP